MPALTQIKLSAVALVEDISQAPLGTLLQFGGMTLIRAEHQNSDNPLQGVVEIEAGGVWSRLNNTRYRQAFDLTGLAEISIAPGEPVRRGLHEVNIGGAYLITDSSGSRFPAQAVAHQEDFQPKRLYFTGFLVLSGPDRGKILNGVNEYFYLGHLKVSPLET